MHEISIMTEAVRMAVEAAQAAGSQRITSLRLQIGTLSGAVPEAMNFAWEVVTEGTIAAGARLEIESVPATAWCAGCQLEFPVAKAFTECPTCHQISPELRRGRELGIESVEVE